MHDMLDYQEMLKSPNVNNNKPAATVQWSWTLPAFFSPLGQTSNGLVASLAAPSWPSIVHPDCV